MNKNLKVGVLLGGLSAEREVSLRSGRAVLEALAERGYTTVAIDADRNVDVKLREAKIDVAFLALHGTYGEDGCVQGLLEIMGIPYTGSGVLASALAMDKLKAKEVFWSNNIPTPAYVDCKRGTVASDAQLRAVVHAVGGGPAFVKPRRCGSSVGASKASTIAELKERLDDAWKQDEHAIVEQCVEGQEITVGLKDGVVFGMLEVLPKQRFYDFTAKYTPGQTEYVHPPRVSEVTLKKIETYSASANRVLGASSITRADLMIDAQGEPFVLEVNTLPGLTKTSLVPRMYELMGKTYADMCEDILASALESRP